MPLHRGLLRNVPGSGGAHGNPSIEMAIAAFAASSERSSPHP